MNDRYKILSTLATGGRGTVFRAFDTSQNRDVAIKRLHANGTDKESLQREARRLYGIRHPSLVTILDYGNDDQGTYLVMEMLKGESLEQRLSRGPLSLDEFRELVLQSLGGISAAHEGGLLHCDLKAGNLMVLWDVHNAFRIKIVDFGLAQPLAPGGAPSEANAGSVHTMAPELFSGGLIDARTDLYALGVIYYQALTGRMPFDGDNHAQIVTAHLQHKLIPLAELRPDISNALCQWIESLIHPNPAARPADAATALAQFEKLRLEDRPLTAAEVVEEAVPMIAVAEPVEVEPVQAEIAALTTPLVAAAPPLLSPDDTAPVLSADDDTAPILAAGDDTAPILAADDSAPVLAANDTAPILTPSDTAPILTADETVPVPTPDDTAPVLAPSDTAPAPTSDAAAPTLTPGDAAPATTPEETAPAPSDTAPVLSPDDTTLPPDAPNSWVPPDSEPVRSSYLDNPPPSRQTLPKTKQPKRRRSTMQIIIGSFTVILLAQFGFISWYKHSQREARTERFAELAALDHPAGSDLDTRLLLEFLDDPTTQDSAATTLAHLHGGEYIDQLVLAHLNKVRNFPACEKLLQVLGQRRYSPAFTAVASFLEDGRGQVRQAAWTALGTLTPASELPRILQSLPKASSRDHEVITKALIAAVQNSDDRRAATQAVIAAWQSAPGDSPHRALLFNVITRVGGTDTMAIITQAIADPSERVRRAAITLLAEYPTHDPLPVIEQRFPEEADDTCRTYLLIAAIELVSRPGPFSQQVLFAHGRELWSHTRDRAERRYVLSLLGRIITPETAEFFERYADTLQGEQRREAHNLAKSFRDELEKVIPLVPGDDLTTLPADRADYRLGGSLAQRDGTLVDWSDTADWASWLIELPKPGKYEIRIHQAHKGKPTGTYEVQIGEHILRAAVVNTRGEFKGFILGEVEIPSAGIYKIYLRPHQLPASGELFRVQKLSLKPAD
jgi:serine/threonine protein kinase